MYNVYLYVYDAKNINKKITHWNRKSTNHFYNEFCLFEIFLLFQIMKIILNMKIYYINVKK